MTLNTVLRYVVIGGVFSLLLTPFFVFNSFFFPFITSKAFVFRIAVEILFVLWLLLAFRNRLFLPRFSWLLGTAVIFVAIIGVANIFAVNPYKAFWSNFERMEGFITLIHLLMYFVVASSVLITEKLWKIFLNISVAASVIMCIYGFRQLAGDVPINQGGVRLDGTLGNAIYLAVYMLFNIYFAALLFVRSRFEWPRLRFAYVAIILMQIVILYYTATRGVILGLIGGAIVTALMIALFDRENKKIRRNAVVGLIAILVLVGGFFLIKDSDFVSKSPTLSRFASLSVKELTTQGRYYVWPMAISGFKDRPLLGWGQEGFSYVFNKYYNPAMYNQEAWFDRTHNTFLDWLVAGGILGLLSYLSILVFLVVYLWRSSLDIKNKAILTGLIAAYVFQNIFAFDNLTSYILFFSVVALIHVETTKGAQPIRWLERLSEHKRLSQFIIVPLVGIVVVFALYTANVQPILANRDLLKAVTPDSANPNVPRISPHFRLEQFKKVFARNTFGSPEAREQMLVNLSKFHADGVDPAVRREYEHEAIKQYAAQIEKTPYETRQLLFYASFLNRASRFADALPIAQKALATSPKKQIVRFEVGVAQSGLGKNEEALETFRQAFELEPDYVEARQFYVLAAIYAKKLDLAQKLFNEASPAEVVFDNRVVNAYIFNGHMDKAIEIFVKRVELEPTNVQHHFNLAAAYNQIKNGPKTIEWLRKAIEVDPSVREEAEFFIKAVQEGRPI